MQRRSFVSHEISLDSRESRKIRKTHRGAAGGARILRVVVRTFFPDLSLSLSLACSRHAAKRRVSPRVVVRIQNYTELPRLLYEKHIFFRGRGVMSDCITWCNKKEERRFPLHPARCCLFFSLASPRASSDPRATSPFLSTFPKESAHSPSEVLVIKGLPSGKGSRTMGRERCLTTDDPPSHLHTWGGVYIHRTYASMCGHGGFLTQTSLSWVVASTWFVSYSQKTSPPVSRLLSPST